MISIVLEKDESGRIHALRCDGHAGFSASPDGGVDIVCAAVSALTGYLGITLTEVLAQPEAVSARDGSFVLARSADWPESVQQTLDVMLDGWERAVRSLEDNYSGWVKVAELAR